MNKVCAVNSKNYDKKNVQVSIDRIFELLDLKSKIDISKRVLIKPNLLMKRKPSDATTTHPMIIEAIINALKHIGVNDIIIAESPAGMYTKQTLNDIYKVCGMKEVAETTGIKLNEDTGYKTTYFNDGVVCKSFNIINPILEADYIITVGKVKTHGMTTMSGAIKNTFGVIPGLQKPEMHCLYNTIDTFSEMMLDLNLCVKPNLAIMDGIECMEGDGPSGGTPITCNFIAASQNIYDLDVFLSHKIGLNPEDVPMVSAAIKRDLCVKSITEVDIVGDREAIDKVYKLKLPHSVNVDFAYDVPKILRKPAKFVLNKLLVAKPVINTKKCVGCGKCAESCPQHTISIIDKKAHINYKKCIHCFCCHEMCPIKSIGMKRIIKF